tara:strand:- start:67 stop:207 length:141 start_codon:yes stop_codon:yes gene_type:complete
MRQKNTINEIEIKKSIKRIEKRVAKGKKLLKKHSLFKTMQLMKKEK